MNGRRNPTDTVTGSAFILAGIGRIGCTLLVVVIVVACLAGFALMCGG